MARVSTASRELIGKRIGGRYIIEQLLGEGGMGAVFAARELETSQRVALKIIHAELAATKKEHVARFIQETLAAALVNHPNVVRSLGAFEDEDGRPILVLELLEGSSLDRMIRRGRMPLTEAVGIAMQASHGIAAAHTQGIIHRDLKPANIFVARSADTPLQIKVLDFGVALLRDPLRDPEASRHTDHGVLLGTLDYMSPEQLQDARAADERSDVYALGVILYEMLTGKVPFRAETDPMLVVKILSVPPESLSDLRPDLPKDFVKIVERAMAKDPAQRFQSMGAFASAIEPYAHERPPADAPPRTSRKALLQWIVIAVLAAVALIATLMR